LGFGLRSVAHFPFIELCPGFEPENSFGRARTAANQFGARLQTIESIPIRPGILSAYDTDRLSHVSVVRVSPSFHNTNVVDK
jgi:hypothetical protein